MDNRNAAMRAKKITSINRVNMRKVGKGQAQEREVNTGAGAIEKACRILKAMTDPRNARLSDIATYCGMEKSTAMR
ncbi:MAG: IclR family transcriptional regulator, partial [Paucimonas sp.]|nr:IclR family transcriptional regulator [Paucimonas sp.]